MSGLFRFVWFLSALLAAGAFAQSQNMTMKVAGVNRKYILYAPTGLGDNPPLVYVIHGFNMSGQQEVQLTRMNAVADKGKFLVVYPDALPDGNNQQSWDMSGPNDFAFLLGIIDSVDAKYHIDRNRIYASGFSQGGFMSFQLGCRYADVFAAIAPVSGLINGTCNPKRPVPMKFTFGTNEGFDVNTFIQSMNKWVQLNGCDPAPTVIRPYPPSNANSVVTRLSYGGCRDSAAVVVDTVKGGPHEWPMNTQTKINNSEEVWAFVSRFSLPEATALPRGRHARSASEPAVRYAGGMVELVGVDESAWVRIIDTKGRVVAASASGQRRFDFRGRPHGIYQVIVDGRDRTFGFRMAVP